MERGSYGPRSVGGELICAVLVRNNGTHILFRALEVSPGVVWGWYCKPRPDDSALRESWMLGQLEELRPWRDFLEESGNGLKSKFVSESSVGLVRIRLLGPVPSFWKLQESWMVWEREKKENDLVSLLWLTSVSSCYLVSKLCLTLLWPHGL